MGEVDYTVADCRTPPVTFALLCDVYQLLQRHHADAPLDPATLAAGAALGATSYDADDGAGDSVQGFTCAIPEPAFETTCDAIAGKMAVGAVDVGGAIEEAVTSMIALSMDPFTYYVPPELAGAFTEDGVVTAVGLLLNIVNSVGSTCKVVEAGCRLEVAMALPDGPAYDAGVRAGDVVAAIDGIDVAGMTLVEVAGALDGEDGTSVTLDIETDDRTQSITVERRTHAMPSVEIDRPRPDVAYIRLPDFGVDTAPFLHAVLEEINETGIDRLVLDLRDNPGGFVDVVTLVASEFLSDGLVLRTSGSRGDFDYPVQDGGVAHTRPSLTVIVNGGSASAAEILAAVLQERGRASIVGQPTFGKNTVQIGFPLRNDGELRVTIARWLTPEGATVAGTGVVPDVLVDIPTDASADEVVDLVSG